MFQVVGNLWARWTEFVWSSTLMKTSGTKYTACDSPECVRCVRYQQVRQEAWGRLQRYAERHGWTGLDPLLLAIGEGKRYREVRGRLGQDREVRGRLGQDREVRGRLGQDRAVLSSLMPLPLQNPNVLFVPTLRKLPWWGGPRGGGGGGDGPPGGEPHPFTHEQATLEANHDVILQEFQQVFKDMSNMADTEGAGWTVNSTERGRWCAYHLYNQGRKVPASCQRCPQTTKLIEGLTSVMTGSLFGNVSFSVIFPQTHIDEHYGPCNVRVRCHLGLEVPPGCVLKVAGEERTWSDRHTVFFDDSFLHSATNSHQTAPRAVLLVDLWHPDVTSRAREALLHVF